MKFLYRFLITLASAAMLITGFLVGVKTQNVFTGVVVFVSLYALYITGAVSYALHLFVKEE